MTSSSILFVSLVFVVLATNVNAQTSCPAYITACYCNSQSNSGYILTCSGSTYTPEEIKSSIEYYGNYGPIDNVRIINIYQSKFNFVVDDFLARNQIPSVSFTCHHQYSVTENHLSFSANAFSDSTGKCGLIGNLTITDCSIHQFNAAVLNNCNQLEKLAFMYSHVESIIEIPTLKSLTNFTVYSNVYYNGATQQGLSRFSLARGAKLPHLRYLDLTGNSLTDDEIAFIPELTTIEELHLVNNLYTTAPVLTNSVDLHTFSLTLTNEDISISLPHPRTQTRPLNASFYSAMSNITYNVTSIEGEFTANDLVSLKFKMNDFTANVFLAPLSSGLTVNLNPDSRFNCGCAISWLVRDNRELLPQVKNGYCKDGRSFQAITEEEVSCCSIHPLVNRIGHQQEEINKLKSAVKQLRLIIESSKNADKLLQL